MKVALITPAWQRFELTAICLRQKKAMFEELADWGIEGTVVVVADDENLKVAEDLGFVAVDHPNDVLGRKFNAGYEKAAELGYDYAMAVGSDTFLSPATFMPLRKKKPPTFFATTNYSLVHRSGTRRLDLVIDWGVHQCIYMPLMEKLNYRPVNEAISRGCDTSTRNRIVRSLLYKSPVTIEFFAQHDMEAVAFQSRRQITSFNAIARSRRRTPVEGTIAEIMAPMAGLYPPTLIEEVKAFYASGRGFK